MFLLVNTKTGEQKKVGYPRFDKKPVALDKDLELYTIKENTHVITDAQYLSPLSIRLTEEQDTEYPVKIAIQDYEIIDMPVSQEATIDDLKEAIIIVAKEKKDRTTEEEARLVELTTKIKSNEKTIVSSVNTDVRIK